MQSRIFFTINQYFPDYLVIYTYKQYDWRYIFIKWPNHLSFPQTR